MKFAQTDFISYRGREGGGHLNVGLRSEGDGRESAYEVDWGGTVELEWRYRSGLWRPMALRRWMSVG
jgi:hypothetical protein